MLEQNCSEDLLVKASSNGVTGSVYAVSNGLEAIEYLMGEGPYAERERFPYPSFILTGLKMLHVDGFDLLLHLKNNPQWARTPTASLFAHRPRPGCALQSSSFPLLTTGKR